MIRTASILTVCLALQGCSFFGWGVGSSSQSNAPTAPASQQSVASLGDSITESASKVAAAVTVARENADKPEVVKAESQVALSHLPPPPEGELAIARLRASKADAKTYQIAEQDGQRLLAAFNLKMTKVKEDQAKVEQTIKDLRAQVADLTKEVKTARSEGRRDFWTAVGALLIVGGIATGWFFDRKLGVLVGVAGGFCASIPKVIESAWFNTIAGITVGCIAALVVWVMWDKARDEVHANDPKP